MNKNYIKTSIYTAILIASSVVVNNYYGHLGVFPLDTFLFFDSGSRVLDGQIGVRDYWASTGILIDLMQALLFKILGVSFSTYVFHASLMNLILTVSTFFVLKKFKLNNIFSFYYSLLLSFSAYVISGTPFLDHHSIIFSILAMYCFFIAIQSKKNIFWVLVPFLLFLGFFSKQSPAIYLIFLISILSLIYFLFNFSIKPFLSILFSFLLCSAIIIFLLIKNNIELINFYNQYFSYPASIGDLRMNIDGFIKPFEFSRYILKFKFIHLSYLFLVFFLLSNTIKNKKILKDENFYILLVLIIFPLLLIFHQLMSLNQKFVGIIIPVLFGFSHVFFLRSRNLAKTQRSIIRNLLIFLSAIYIVYNFTSYVDNRRFMELKNINLKNAVDAKIIDKKLSGLKWITFLYPNDPMTEIKLINNSINLLRANNENFLLLTDYSFLYSIIGKNIYTTSRVHDSVSIPLYGEKNFIDYKNLFIKIIKKNNIKKIYIMEPVKLSSIKEIFVENCLTASELNEILKLYIIEDSCIY